MPWMGNNDIKEEEPFPLAALEAVDDFDDFDNGSDVHSGMN